ncbi:DEAD DEAH box helicase Helicase conserved C terminal domain [Trypanosoma vivax]|nr:DEAD DEAH box helicase Helicase conserved C terminal domain [Trypanosoma vivax]
MNVYSWESSGARKAKAKKTGTVVFHANEAIDPSFDRLQKEYPLEKQDSPNLQQNNAGEHVQREVKRAPLMTAGTVKALVKKMGFTALLPCQAQCYRGIFNRRDVILHSRTGSGKTLAYALPIFERHLILGTGPSSNLHGPFVLIFLFSNVLAVQTKGVLGRIYPKLNICVAGFDDLSTDRCDVLIGTVQSMDEAIRGSEHTGGARGLKRRRGTAKGSEEMDEASGDTEDGADDSEEERLDDKQGATEGDTCRGALVSAADVRVVVVDEVDLTLGPRFSNIGRRMRNLLKFVRKANGSLNENLLTDFRTHQYVLCGATIPNWVVKAGFLGVKKYYYQLVTVGTAKLPNKLQSYSMYCPHATRVEAAAQLITRENFGRMIVFGTGKQIARLGVALAAERAKLSFRVLDPSKGDLDMIEAIETFNSKTAAVLLCTDVAARGIDFVDVHTVLMLSLPSHNMAVETFVHRAGRTARAAREGVCLQLYDEREKNAMEAVEKSAHVTFKRFIPASGTEKDVDDAGPRVSTSQKPVSVGRAAFVLTVKNPFRYTKRDATVPSALDVLKKHLGELFPAAGNVAEDSARESVSFDYPIAEAHVVKQRLWKFSLKECTSDPAA